MPNLDIGKLSGSLKAGLHNLYVIHGEEDLLRIEAADLLRATAKRMGYHRDSFTVDSASFDWGDILANADSASLFAEQKLLEIHIPSGKVGKQGGEILLELAEHLPPDTVTLIVLPKLEKAQIQSKWFGALAKYGTILEAKAVTSTTLPAWISERLQQYGLEADADALALFAERVEGNLLAAKQEIDKLALLYPKGHLLTMADAEQAVANVARFDVFQLASAWMNGDARRVMRLLDGLAAEGDEPVLLLWALAEDVRTLIRLSAAIKQGQSVQAVRNQLRLWDDKQTLAPKAAARLSPMRLLAALQECARIDRQIKGAEDGDAWASFRQLVLQLAT